MHPVLLLFGSQPGTISLGDKVGKIKATASESTTQGSGPRKSGGLLESFSESVLCP